METFDIIIGFIGVIFLYVLYNEYKYNITKNALTKIYTAQSFPKQIWIYWNTPIDTAPKIVQTCVHLIQKLNPHFQVNILNENNYTDYVKDERVIYHMKSDILHTYKSDLLRWYLIYTYGGLYVDASVLPFCSFEWIVNEMNVSGKSLLLYNNVHHTRKRLEPVFEEWLIAGVPGTDISRLVYTEFLKCLNEGVNQSFHRLISDPSVDYQNFANHGPYHLIYFLMIQLFSKYKLHSQIKSLRCSYDSYPCLPIGGYVDFNTIFKNKTTYNEFQRFAYSNRFAKLTAYNRTHVEQYQYPLPDTIIYYLLNQS